jgi:AcrR family transcriptional regulator
MARIRKLPRRRRSPEVAKLEILEAADRVFAESQPDQVGLKEVAREAGVSHALVTHYYGSYAALIEAVLERRVRALREKILVRLQEPGVLGRPAELIGVLFEALDEPVHVRLMRWLLASERPAAAHAFAFRDQGLHQVARSIGAALTPDAPSLLIVQIELALATAVSAAYGYALAKHALVGALGRRTTKDLDAQVQTTLATMLQLHLRAQLAAAGREIPEGSAGSGH